MGVENVPKHLAIILDGNRRFAKKLMVKPWKGHEWGSEKVENLLKWVKELGIKEVTLYAFSIQNFDRPKQEFDYLMKVFDEAFDRLLEGAKENSIKVNFLGRIWMFPKHIHEKMQKIMESTKNNSGYILNLAMSYGGREEIIDATKKIAEEIKQGKTDVSQINEEFFEKHLWNASQPDIIIRTGGERRTSNFLSFQSAYSEWFFLEKTWPEFEKEDLLEVIAEYNKRNRRFGK
ncbi:di-trans,poly-cis-decaprenylcistransferase [Candidatus Woesearchaeota archaeon]|nr:di-trans,poly-cis-decaprenylcistransferase [Candidatus Woesearchaeota archaeon]